MKKISAVFIIALFLFSGYIIFRDKAEKKDTSSDLVSAEKSVEDALLTFEENDSKKNNEKALAITASTKVVSSVEVDETPLKEELSDAVEYPDVVYPDAVAVTPSEDITKKEETASEIAEAQEAEELQMPVPEIPRDEVEMGIEPLPVFMEEDLVNGPSPAEIEAPDNNQPAPIAERSPEESEENSETGQLQEGANETLESSSGKDVYDDNEVMIADGTENTLEPALIIPEEQPSSHEVGNDEPAPVEEVINNAEAVLPEVVADKSEVGEENRIALLPFENLTNERDVLKQVMPVLKYYLEKKGMNVVHGTDLENYLCKERVRSAGLVSKELAMKLKDKFNVKAILTGSIISFTSDEHPKFGILVRLIDSSRGTILWADYASATGDDYTTILGLGRIKSIYSLVPRVMENLFSSFSAEILHKETRALRKVVVMPFQNNSDFENAGKIAMYMFLDELLKNKQYEPVEYGNARQQIIKLQIRERGELDHEKIRSLSEPLGAEGLLLGVVDMYANGTENASSPKVAITARLIDSGKSRIVWYNSHQLSGEDEVIALDWGRVRSVHNVAHNVVVHLVKQMGMTTWH